MATAAQLREALHLVCEARHRLVVVDLGALLFVSLAGLHVVAEAQQILQAAAGRLVLVNPDAITVRVLALTGLDQVLHLLAGGEHLWAEEVYGVGRAVDA